MVIPWRCTTCQFRAPSHESLREHRVTAHPDLEAAAIAFSQVLDNNGSDEEADDAYDLALRDYRQAGVA